MNCMFLGALSFNQPVGKWNTSNVTDMHGMFSNAESFNHPIGEWNSSKVWNMGRMFASAGSFNQPIDKWNTSNVTDMSEMFCDAEKFNCPVNTGMFQVWRTAAECLKVQMPTAIRNPPGVTISNSGVIYNSCML